MTSEGSKTFMVALILKTGQSVAHRGHNIFYLGFFYLTEDIFKHFIGLISDFRL